jgi:hypothetical protein
VGECQIRQIAFEELDTREMIEVAALSCDQGVCDPDAVPAPYEFLCQVRSDEAGPAGHEVMSHAVDLSNNCAALV